MAPSDAQVMYLAGVDRDYRLGGLWHTADGGVTWQRANGRLPVGDDYSPSISVDAANPNTVLLFFEDGLPYGTRQFLWRSGDGGDTWLPQGEAQPGGANRDPLALIVDPARPQTLYLARAYLVHGQPQDAISWAERAVVAGPWLEEGHRLLMRGLARSGHRSRALKVYDDAVTTLRQELDAPPSTRIGWLAERLRREEEI